MIVTAKNADITNFEILFLESLGFFFLRIKYTGNMNNVRKIVPPIIAIENNSTNTIIYLYLTLENRNLPIHQIQILAFLYFRSYNIIFYHNNGYFSSKKAPKHFCPSAIKSHFYTLNSNPFLNMNLISSLAFTTTSCTRLPQTPASNS